MSFSMERLTGSRCSPSPADRLTAQEAPMSEIENILHESRRFPPSDSFRSGARISSEEEYQPYPACGV